MGWKMPNQLTVRRAVLLFAPALSLSTVAFLTHT